MLVQTIIQPISKIDAPWIVVGIFDGPADQLPASLAESPLAEIVRRGLAAQQVSTSLGDMTPLWGVEGLAAEGVFLFGLGTRARWGPGPAFSAGVAMGKHLAAKPRDNVAVVLPPSDGPPLVAAALTEGVIVGTQSPGLWKGEPNRHSFRILQIAIPPREAADPAPIQRAVERGSVVGHAVNMARQLVNTPPSQKPPRVLGERMRDIAIGAGIEATLWDESRLREERFGGLLGVAAGSTQPPAFLVLELRRGGDRPTMALVGKGVTFDSGGLSLKPTASMEDMKGDMAGAATVLAAFQAAAQLELPVNLAGYLPLTENMTGGGAMKLGDVLKMRNGKTVEVLNTDAEGRLILADALSFATEQRPARIVDLATLTGACIVALGTKTAGLFSNDDAFASELLEACRRTGERAWRLPLDDDAKDALKSQVADLKNVGGKWGGAITAARFLEHFVNTTPWIHLDIAGPSWADNDSPTRDAGATGCFIPTLVTLVEATMTRE
jgi:leucyl aminopeptidase